MSGKLTYKPYFYSRKKRLITLCLLVFLGICVQLFASYALDFFLRMIPEVKANYSELIDSLIEYDSRTIIWVCIVAPVLEECFFRFIVMHLGLKFMPFWAANVLQAVIFGLYHGNIVQGIYAFVLGLLLGFIRYDSGTIFASIILHMSINTAGVLYTAYPILNGEGMEKTLLIVVTVLTAAGAVIVKFLHTLWNAKVNGKS